MFKIDPLAIQPAGLVTGTYPLPKGGVLPENVVNPNTKVANGVGGNSVLNAANSALEGAGTVANIVKNISKKTSERMDEKGMITHKVTPGANMLGAASAGYNIGKNFGPWGAAIGAGVGAIAGGVASIFDNNKQPTAEDQLSTRKRFELGQEIQTIQSENAVAKQQLMAEDGMNVLGNTKQIEVERNEVVLRKIGNTFKKVADFKHGKPHSQGGEEYVASPGDIIFPGKLRNKINHMLTNRRWSSIESERMRLPIDVDQTKAAEGIQEIDPPVKEGVMRSASFIPKNYMPDFTPGKVTEVDPWGLKAKEALYKRQPGDKYVVPARPLSENGTAIIPTVKTLKGATAHINNPEAKASAENFMNWYTHPETIKRFGANTGLDPNRLQDFVGKGLKASIKKVGIDELGTASYGTYKDAELSGTPHGQILYRPNSDTDATIQHELVHGSNLDSILGKKLREVTGYAVDQKQNKADRFKQSRQEYMSNPQESYGNFHGFRVKLGLKPGQKITVPQLKKLVKEKKALDDNFYKTYDDENIVKAINTIAYEDPKPTKGSWLDRFA